MARRYYRRKGYKKIKKNETELMYGLGGVTLLILLLKYPEFFILGLILIATIIIAYKLSKRIQFRSSGINEIDQMDGIEFEKRLEVLFKDLGYKVKRTVSTGDYGADLILKKDIDKIVVQAKRYSSPVGIKAIQEALSGKAYYGANKAIVITNSTFTDQAKNLAKKANIELIARDELISMLYKANSRREAMEV